MIVTLRTPSLMSRFSRSLDDRAASPLDAVGSIAAAQAKETSRLMDAIPTAQVVYRYRLVADGFALVVPTRDLGILARLPGIAKVWPNLTYHSLSVTHTTVTRAQLVNQGPQVIGADKLWGPTLATAGQGMKIGVIDDGIDARHVYFDPAGFAYPAGFPKGLKSLASRKVIVQRTFAPPTPSYVYKSVPFDPSPNGSFHATHVAGIAAGDHNTQDGAVYLSGVAPDAFLGNYKALTIPTPGFGLDGNSASIAAAIEAAVSDGMNVINLSLGEPEIAPSRDFVVHAIDAAAQAGVVPVIAADNQFDQYGYGSVSSPANAPDAITVAATTLDDTIADFSSGGPTPVSKILKPDVSAPGVAITSSLPVNQAGPFGAMSGTSMAAPQVSGAAALLMQRHPTWTVEEIKSALVLGGRPRCTRRTPTHEVFSCSARGRRPDRPRARRQPARVRGADLALVPGRRRLDPDRPHRCRRRRRHLDRRRPDAEQRARGRRLDRGLRLRARDAHGPRHRFPSRPRTATSPASSSSGRRARTPAGSPSGSRSTIRCSGRSPRRDASTHPGIYSGTTRGRPEKVEHYRYPTAGDASYPGPERGYLVHVTGPIANFGVAVLSGSAIPHVVFAGDENHLVGFAGLPTNINPYLDSFGEERPVAGDILPAPGTYEIVFDTRSAKAAGPFTFRYWVNDTTPPKVSVLSRTGGKITLSITDKGAGVDPESIKATLDGHNVIDHFADGVLTIQASPGRHLVIVTASDYQELKNMEDVAKIEPNTTTLRRSVVVQ